MIKLISDGILSIVNVGIRGISRESSELEQSKKLKLDMEAVYNEIYSNLNNEGKIL